MVSFFLVQHWYFRIPSYKAGLKVFVISQVGDVPLFFFVILVIFKFYSTDFFIITHQFHLMAFDYIVVYTQAFHFASVCASCIIFAALLKGAQVFFYP